MSGGFPRGDSHHASSLPRISPQESLLIDEVCDRYERTLIDDDSWHPPTELSTLSEPARRIADQELSEIRRRFEEERDSAKRVASSNFSKRAERCPSRLPMANRFEYQHRLGRGGAGSVWKAFDRDLKRTIAIKVAHTGTQVSLARFRREALSAARLKHSNIVRLHEVIFDESIEQVPVQNPDTSGEAQSDRPCALVYEYVDGHSLAERASKKPVSIDQAVRWTLAIADALCEAHRHGIIHRDVKPHNILIDGNDHPWLTDFGLAFHRQHDSNRLTMSGDMIGTPAFMSPELTQTPKLPKVNKLPEGPNRTLNVNVTTGNGVRADQRTDVYSLGACCFFW